ncbi:MAG: hypothetical protein PHI45_03535 [Candidatus Pacebacteria bacterium]|jgi:hypothetical protein|nr:hypothetical protein [Candidatus Paceibacterota bacterium]MDD5013454.1 hypothetical protein [Candidatus Paceibacterota bacterium]MDD5753121.1 hypothetical protein [Candidatus Paceibacterota bacterium]
MLGLKINPELIIIFPFALMLDAIGIILVCFGLDDVGITDTIGLVFLGSWLWFRKGIKVKIDRKDFKRGFKFLGATIGEYIPYLGALPFWTITVFFTLKESNEGPNNED